jgi:predicted Abi (CAAX) family protease
VLRDGRWIAIDDVVDEAPAVVAEPGPCTCLTKTYTPSGLVVFADVCTKESASASVDGSADATQVPTTPVAAMAVPMSVVPTTPNYAGRTYEDYLAANPQAAQPQASTPPAAAAPQKK